MNNPFQIKKLQVGFFAVDKNQKVTCYIQDQK